MTELHYDQRQVIQIFIYLESERHAPDVLVPIAHVFLLCVSLIQNRRNSLAFEIMSLR